MELESGAVTARAVDRLRRLKHAAFVRYRRYRWVYAERSEPLVRAYHRRFPQRLRPSDLSGTFADHTIEVEVDPGPVDRTIYCFWTGDNDLSPNRVAALEALREANPGIDVELVTPDTLPRYLHPDAPLNMHYSSLSFVHRADYLRCYFLHFHGGGYTDVKTNHAGWAPAFDAIDASPSTWLMGYRNPVRVMTPNFTDRRLERLMVRWSDRRLGQCSYIARPRTPITEEWWRQLNRLIDDAGEALSQFPGDARGTNLGYPLGWNSLLAQILDPLTVKYVDHLQYDARLMPSHEDYL